MTPMSIKLEPLAMDPALFTLPTPSFSETPADYTISLPNRISSLYFWADGMVPLSINVDRLVVRPRAQAANHKVHRES